MTSLWAAKKRGFSLKGGRVWLERGRNCFIFLFYDEVYDLRGGRLAPERCQEAGVHREEPLLLLSNS